MPRSSSWTISPGVIFWEGTLTEALLKKLDRSLFREGETVVAAVSGGADSVALLDLLSRCRRPALSLVVAHLNHSLRGAASDGDESFVADLAASYRLPFIAQRVDVAGFSRDQRLSLEDAGREVRYGFFRQVAADHGATSIALAHHRDDQAETVLMRLLRGAGGSGLTAMRPVAQGILKRPLLRISREELERYLQARGLSWRNDESNDDTAYLRNSIRHELIPMLRRYNPAVCDRLCATADILAADEELLQQMTERAFAAYGSACPEGVVLKGDEVAREPRGLRLRLYRHAIAVVKGDLSRIALTHLESVDNLLTAPSPSARLDLPDGITATRRYADLWFFSDAVGSASPHLQGEGPGEDGVPVQGLPEWQAHRRHHLPTPKGRAQGSPPLSPWSIPVPAEGRYPLPGGRVLLVQRVPHPGTLVPPSANIAFMSPEGVPFPLVVRGFRPGDRFRPLGMQGEQKVKDLFIDRKIPRSERPLVPLLFSGADLVWVGGIRLGETARIAGETGDVVRVELLTLNP
ncbi:tRNA lysidine(34) synthetase TilS [Geomesophilobacter sediminis]|uniref:tRNA(Ile)-lysidine synthase n=1 Tax=Geomesophilobacter sediminis TaxID=2798584 RepID=A0A8J7S8C4_9BACT|nr:tRNA lysidine(34) synthetase TilS [Geomesophilobacter sediminis]MBJ6727492.1 tRNA lysidine(34) synthetase TilS [Geomesophilobacter sediminis]